MNLYDLTAILGTVPDREIARISGCSPRAARRYRIALGIPECARDYRSALDAVSDAFGIVPDRVIAAATGESLAAVVQHRYNMVIPEPKEWTGEQTAYERVDEWIDIVGALPDAVVAGFVGVSAAEVTEYREARGFLLECEEEVPAVSVHAPPKPGNSRVSPYAHRLGVDTDVVIAQLAGVNPSSVRRMRERMGISACENREPPSRNPDTRLSRIEAFVCSAGGDVSSTEVGRKFGITPRLTSRELRTLTDTGRIARVDRGLYSAPVSSRAR